MLGCLSVTVFAIFRMIQASGEPSQSGKPSITQVAVIPAAPTAVFVEPSEMPEEITPDLPEPAPSETSLPQEPEEQLTRYTFEGLSFSYDPMLAAAVDAEIIEAQTGADLPSWELAPEHRRLTFLAYTLEDTYHTPRIYVYPVQDYLAIDPGIGDLLATLQQMLLMKPSEDLPSPVPFFPNWNAGQMMVAQVKYLDFQSGSGLRYLVQYGQDVYPINNQSMFYTFQGLTRDGQWLISVVLPVANPILPDPDSVLEAPGFYDNFHTYLGEVTALLNEQPENSFEPALSVLDALFQSFDVE